MKWPRLGQYGKIVFTTDMLLAPLTSTCFLWASGRYYLCEVRTRLEVPIHGMFVPVWSLCYFRKNTLQKSRDTEWLFFFLSYYILRIDFVSVLFIFLGDSDSFHSIDFGISTVDLEYGRISTLYLTFLPATHSRLVLRISYTTD